VSSLRIGMVCYASLGGSGVVATELARALAGRGHDVHVISSERPFRWWEDVPGLTLHPVAVPSYPLFREPQYLLAVANAIARVAEAHRLDVVHAHYAVPHATAAYLADEMLSAAAHSVKPRTVTTLHGTDITLVGSDPSYARVVAFSIERSDVVTAVSHSLKADTITGLGIQHAIEVIPNFLDCGEYQRRVDEDLRRSLSPPGTEGVVVHISNFRPVKRVDLVLEVFRRIRRDVAARLVLIGDGPDRAMVEARARDYGLADHVVFAGEEQDLVRWLSAADVFLLPSEKESFGLAALEAMACEVPVIASNAGGLPEIIHDGENGYVSDLNAIDEMAANAVRLLRSEDLRRGMGRRGAELVRENYCTDRIVPMYERAYQDACKAR
jgi:N-acetyl-alpha-D-glucosaminyl L-malate synthase BshA